MAGYNWLYHDEHLPLKRTWACHVLLERLDCPLWEGWRAAKKAPFYLQTRYKITRKFQRMSKVAQTIGRGHFCCQMLFCIRLFGCRLLGQSNILRREGRQTWGWGPERKRLEGEKCKSLGSRLRRWYLRKKSHKGKRNTWCHKDCKINIIEWYHEWIPDTQNHLMSLFAGHSKHQKWLRRRRRMQNGRPPKSGP